MGEGRKYGCCGGVLPTVEFRTLAWFKAEAAKEAPEDALESIKRTSMKVI
jgi:hypothetical protein